MAMAVTPDPLAGHTANDCWFDRKGSSTIDCSAPGACRAPERPLRREPQACLDGAACVVLMTRTSGRQALVRPSQPFLNRATTPACPPLETLRHA
jgi:hypothetical protein